MTSRPDYGNFVRISRWKESRNYGKELNHIDLHVMNEACCAFMFFQILES